jgi:hypothetical protein
MNWEVWDLISSNLLADFGTEAEALTFVREFLARGVKAEELVLILDDPALADEDLPPGISGEDLARRAEAAGSEPTRRTA